MKLLFMTVTVFFMAAAMACSPADDAAAPGIEIPNPAPTPGPAPDPGPTPDPAPEPGPSTGNRMQITVGAASFPATLADNAAGRAFRTLLPMRVEMGELNGNEKYYYLPQRLPTAASSPGAIRAGDLMLFGSDCLVLFYESLATSYSYTRIGMLDDAAGLARAVGAGSVVILFEQVSRPEIG